MSLCDKAPYIQSYGFSSSPVWMWELDHKEGWEPKNWFFQTVVLEKTLESPLDGKETKPVNPKGNQPWIFIGRSCAEAEAPILWPPDVKSQLIGKDPDNGKDWCWSWSSNTLAAWCKELPHWKITWCWERLRAGGERDDRGWDGWMASLTQTWVWASARSWWWTGRPGMLQSMESQRVGHDWVTELN